MMTRRSVLVSLGASVSLLGVVFVSGLYLLQEWHLQRKTRIQVAEAQRLFYTEVDDDARVLHSLADAIEADEPMRQAWAARDREALLARALPAFQNLRSKYGVTHFYFHDLDKTCFLRVHEPSRRGDRIDRFTLIQAADSNRPVHGIELGPLGTFALRIVHPWIIDGQRVGYIELGEEIGHLTQKVRRILGNDLAFFVRKSFLDRQQWETGMSMLGRTPDWGEFPNHVVVDSTLLEIPREIGPNLAAAEVDDAYTADLVRDQGAYRCGFSSLVDAEGRELGRILAIVDIGEERTDVATVAGTAGVIGFLIVVGWCTAAHAYVRRVERRLFAAYAAEQSELEERCRTEDMLRESQEQYRILTDSSLTGIFILQDDRYVFTNARFAEMHGYTVDELIGKCYLSLIHPEERARVQQNVARRLAGVDVQQQYEMRRLTKDGCTIWCTVIAGRIAFRGEPAIMGNIIDITEQRRNEERLRDSEARLRAITDSAQDAIVMMDAQGRVCYWNPAAERILGYRNEEAIGQDLHQLIAPKRYLEAHAAAFPEFQRSGRGKAIGKTIELSALRKDGEEITVALSLSPVHIHGGWHAVGIVRDVTARKQMEGMLRRAKEEAEQSKAMLEHLNHQLEEAIERANLMAQEAVVANQAKSEFLANMSHEIRTPMNGIVGFSDMLGDSPLSQEQRQYVDTIRDCAYNLLQIINDVLDLSKIEARRMTVEYVDCSLTKLLAGIESLTAPKAKSKGRMALPSANPLLTWGYVFPSSARSCTRGRRMRG